MFKLNLRKRIDNLLAKKEYWEHQKKAPGLIQQYLEHNQNPRLQIGAGPTLLQGWLNTTLVPRREGLVHLDATLPYPMPDACVECIFSEHMIEHITFSDGLKMLNECFRVLKPGGTLRLSTPDLERVMELYSPARSPAAESYLRWTVDNFLKDTNDYSPAFVINQMFHGWHHVFIYDFKTLKHALERAGFVNVTRHKPGESEVAALRGVEQHGKVIKNEAMNDFESLVVEGRKPL